MVLEREEVEGVFIEVEGCSRDGVRDVGVGGVVALDSWNGIGEKEKMGLESVLFIVRGV